MKSQAADLARLWAPWRSRFLYQRKMRGCIFCRAVRGRDDRRTYVVRRTRHAFAILNLYPYNNGHLMVVPRRHLPDFSRCTPSELLDLWRLAGRMQALLTRALKPHGFNLGINLGRDGGAGIPGHVHIHLVPRWRGDTNFMTAVHGTKVISESLDALYRRLVRNTVQRDS